MAKQLQFFIGNQILFFLLLLKIETRIIFLRLQTGLSSMFGHTVGMDQHLQYGFLGNITLLSPKSQLHIQFTGSLKLKALKSIQNPLILESLVASASKTERACAVFVSVVLKILFVPSSSYFDVSRDEKSTRCMFVIDYAWVYSKENTWIAQRPVVLLLRINVTGLPLRRV